MKKDYKKYFVSVQKQYNEMNKILERVNKELTEGKCTQEDRDKFEVYFMIIKNNYDRLSYVNYLLNLPPKFIQDFYNKKALKQQQKTLKELEEQFKEQNADQEAIVKENQEALDNIEKTLEKE
jgi:hypothetical protein